MTSSFFEIIDAFVRWALSGFKGSINDYFDEKNEIKSAIRGLIFVVVSLFLVIFLFRLM